jgi:hypothetical protein
MDVVWYAPCSHKEFLMAEERGFARRSLPLKLRANPFRDVVELCPRESFDITRFNPEPKAIVGATWEHVEMHVGYDLTGGRAVGQVEVDAFASGCAASEGPSDALRYSEHVRARFLIEFSQGRGVHDGNDEHVPWELALADIYKGAALVVSENDARRKLARQYVTKDATAHHFSSAWA